MTKLLVRESSPSSKVVVRDGATETVLGASVPSVVVLVSDGPVGPPGRQGPAGPQGPASTSEVHTQNSASSLWTISHSLNKRPNVVVVDTFGQQVWASIFYPDLDTVQVSFKAPTTGIAELS